MRTVSRRLAASGNGFNAHRIHHSHALAGIVAWQAAPSWQQHAQAAHLGRMLHIRCATVMLTGPAAGIQPLCSKLQYKPAADLLCKLQPAALLRVH